MGAECFPLKLALDLGHVGTFDVIWSKFLAWDYVHWQHMLEAIRESEKPEFTQHFIDNPTTDIIMASLEPHKRLEIVEDLINANTTFSQTALSSFKSRAMALPLLVKLYDSKEHVEN